MRNPLQRLAPVWQVQRRRRPRTAARVEDAALTLRTRGDLTGEVRALRLRVAELQRDHLLLAAHVATLTERLAQEPGGAAPDDEAESARQRARVAAVAFYEERIGRLEDRVERLGRARSRPSGRTTGERSERAG